MYHYSSVTSKIHAVFRFPDLYWFFPDSDFDFASSLSLPRIKNGEHNSESASTIDRVITPLSPSLPLYAHQP